MIQLHQVKKLVSFLHVVVGGVTVSKPSPSTTLLRLCISDSEPQRLSLPTLHGGPSRDWACVASVPVKGSESFHSSMKWDSKLRWRPKRMDWILVSSAASTFDLSVKVGWNILTAQQIYLLPNLL